jgi:hypothetical protein
MFTPNINICHINKEYWKIKLLINKMNGILKQCAKWEPCSETMNIVANAMA